MALTTQWDKSKCSLIFERPNRRKERGKGREEEEKRGRRREVQARPKRYGTMNSCMNFHTIA